MCVRCLDASSLYFFPLKNSHFSHHLNLWIDFHEPKNKRHWTTANANSCQKWDNEWCLFYCNSLLLTQTDTCSKLLFKKTRKLWNCHKTCRCNNYRKNEFYIVATKKSPNKQVNFSVANQEFFVFEFAD